MIVAKQNFSGTIPIDAMLGAFDPAADPLGAPDTFFGPTGLKGFLRTIRHLPPGTKLVYPSVESDAELREVVNHLMQLDDQADLLSWVKHECAELAARRLILEAIRHLAIRVSESESKRETANSPGALTSVLVDALRGLPDGLERLASLSHDVELSSEDARRGIREFREALLPQSEHLLAQGASGTYREYLEELLRLNDGEDPLHWIQETHPDQAAYTLLGDSLPWPHVQTPPPLGTVLHAQGPMETVELGGRIQLTAELLVLGAGGFLLDLHLRVSDPALAKSSGSIQMLRWDGFDQVSDDQGFHYIPRRGIGTTKLDHEGRTEVRQRLECFPAVAAGSSELIFSAKLATLTLEVNPMFISAQSPVSRGEPKRRIPIGDLEWLVRIPTQVASESRAPIEHSG